MLIIVSETRFRLKNTRLNCFKAYSVYFLGSFKVALRSPNCFLLDLETTPKKHNLKQLNLISVYTLNILGTRLCILIHLFHKLAFRLKVQIKNTAFDYLD